MRGLPIGIIGHRLPYRMFNADQFQTLCCFEQITTVVLDMPILDEVSKGRGIERQVQWINFHITHAQPIKALEPTFAVSAIEIF